MIPRQLQQLFQSVQGNPFRPETRTAAKGDVVTFRYIGQTLRKIHDPQPIVLLAGFYKDLVYGVNLRYIDNDGINFLVTTDLRNFSYQNYKQYDYITLAYRSYKRQGISDLRMLDIRFLQNLRRIIDITDVAEVEAIRSQIKQLMDQPVNQPKAVPSQEVV